MPAGAPGSPYLLLAVPACMLWTASGNPPGNDMLNDFLCAYSVRRDFQLTTRPALLWSELQLSYFLLADCCSCLTGSQLSTCRSCACYRKYPSRAKVYCLVSDCVIFKFEGNGPGKCRERVSVDYGFMSGARQTRRVRYL